MTPDAAERHRIANRKWATKRRRLDGRREQSPKQLAMPLPRKQRPNRSVTARKQRQRERYVRLRVELIEYQQRWRRANPDKYRRNQLFARRQRDARKRATSTARVSYRRILERDGPFCGICNGFLDPSKLKDIHFDHIIPLAKGGAHVEANIQVAHASCNLRKQANVSP